MKYSVDLTLFDDARHAPSISALTESMGATPRRLRDYCTPLNPYFPTPQIFDSLRARFQAIVKFHPASNRDIAARLADFLGLEADSIVLGNGATELISWINRLIVTESPGRSSSDLQPLDGGSRPVGKDGAYLCARPRTGLSSHAR